MSSIYPVTVPKWGIEMQEGTITEWRFNVGDEVSKGAELVDIESDKIVNTMEAPSSGVLRKVIAEVDETLKVGQLLAVIADAQTSDADIDAFIEAYVPADASFGIDGDDDPAPASASEVRPQPSEPEASSPAAETATSSPEPAAPSDNCAGTIAGEVKISPVARRLANKLGVDISQVKGTGRNGRISTDDIQAAADQSAQAPAPVAPESAEAAQPLSGRALSAARRMVEAKQSIPHFYLQRDLDMRHALDVKSRDSVALTALVIKAMATALAQHPNINAHFKDDALHPQKSVAINVAVDTPEGLVAPLLGDCNAGSAADLAARLKTLAQRARDRELKSEDLAAGGATLSNLGMFGISQFSAIINPPQVVILAVGKLRPVLMESGSVPIPSINATLSCDHRAIDGAAGARFLASVQQALDAL